MSSGTIYNESKLFECQVVQFTMKINFWMSSVTIYNEIKLPIANGWITVRATTSWHAKYGKDDDDDFCEDWHDEVENCLHIWIYKRIKYCT